MMVVLAVILGFVKKYWKYILIGVGTILLIGFFYSWCSKPTATLNPKETQEVIQAIRDGNREELETKLAASDKRLEEAAANSNAAAVNSANAAVNTAVAQKELEEAAERDYGHMTFEELAAEAERRIPPQ